MTKCAYCTDEIPDGKYIRKWFPEAQKFLPVHPYHLDIKRERSNDEIQAEIDTRSRVEITPERYNTEPQQPDV